MVTIIITAALNEAAAARQTRKMLWYIWTITSHNYVNTSDHSSCCAQDHTEHSYYILHHILRAINFACSSPLHSALRRSISSCAWTNWSTCMHTLISVPKYTYAVATLVKVTKRRRMCTNPAANSVSWFWCKMIMSWLPCWLATMLVALCRHSYMLKHAALCMCKHQLQPGMECAVLPW